MSLSETDVERVVAAVETMERSLSVLAEKRSLSRTEYRSDRETRDVVERRFVKLTEAALDIAETLAVNERGTRPESNPGAMVALETAGVLDGPTAARMAEAARFRNILAHTYGDAVDHNDVYDALQDLERYRDFLVAVRDYMDEIDALN